MTDKKYPEGKLCDTDKGAMGCVMHIYKERVRIDFPEEMSWIAMMPEQAEAFAKGLMDFAKELRERTTN